MQSDLLIRRAVAAEREALIALQRRASLIWEEDRAALLAHPEEIDLPPHHIADGLTFVAERARRLVGFGVVLPRSDGDAELDGLFVDPPAWGSGIGRRLVLEAETMALRGGARHLWVVANRRAAAFYAACGFVTISEAQIRFGTAVSMRKANGGSG